MAIVDINKEWKVSKENILYKCAWSPLEGTVLKGTVETTIVSGHLAYQNGVFNESKMGERLMFDRN
jgi:dihydroorotase